MTPPAPHPALAPEFWDGLAEKYAAQPVGDPAAFERKIDVTRAHIPAGGTVLDVGCGTGSLALRLASAAGAVHGLDLSPEMVRIARDKADAAGAANVTFHVGPLDDSFAALPDGSVDVLCAYSILHLVPDRAAALARIFRLLKPGGVLVSSTVCLGPAFGLVVRLMRAVGKAPHVSTFGADTLLGEIERAGFVDVERHHVGAKKNILFCTARRPAA